jgi:hypothetical protein
MVGHRISSGEVDPFSWRFLWVHRFFGSLTQFSTIPLLGYAVTPMWLFAIVRTHGRRILPLSILAVVVGVFATHELFVLTVVVTKAAGLGLTPWQTLTDRTFWPISLAYVVGAFVYLALLAYLGKRSPAALFHVVCGLAALLLLNFAIGIGGYLWNYMLYALPAIVCCLLLALRLGGLRVVIPLTVLLSVATVTYHQQEANLYSQTPGLEARSRELSARLDAILDACHEDRYVYVGLFPEFAFSGHSPLGPIFTPYFHNYLGFDHPLYQETFAAVRDRGRILVEPTTRPKKPASFPEDLRELFAPTPPPCAAGLPTPEGYSVKYRPTE